MGIRIQHYNADSNADADPDPDLDKGFFDTSKHEIINFVLFLWVPVIFGILGMRIRTQPTNINADPDPKH
jgi:hypothetical protein